MYTRVHNLQRLIPQHVRSIADDFRNVHEARLHLVIRRDADEMRRSHLVKRRPCSDGGEDQSRCATYQGLEGSLSGTVDLDSQSPAVLRTCDWSHQRKQ